MRSLCIGSDVADSCAFSFRAGRKDFDREHTFRRWPALTYVVCVFCVANRWTYAGCGLSRVRPSAQRTGVHLQRQIARILCGHWDQMSGNAHTHTIIRSMNLKPTCVELCGLGVALVLAFGCAVQLPVSEWHGLQSGRSGVRLVESGELRVGRRFVPQQWRVVLNIKRLHVYSRMNTICFYAVKIWTNKLYVTKIRNKYCRFASICNTLFTKNIYVYAHVRLVLHKSQRP